MTPALALARWAAGFEPGVEDLRLARRALRDTVAVMLAAGEGPLTRVAGELTEAGRWAALAHALDFDDLHLPSTTHVSAVCVPAALAVGGGSRAYLAGAGVMARLGGALGWSHYVRGWHATCTAGAPAAAAAAACGLGLGAEGIATAITLAVPAAGGVRRAFGSAGKPLQVAFAVEAGVRAARLARAGAGADPRTLEDWMALVGGDPGALRGFEPGVPAVPGGLAIKLYPCCYALQRPIAAALELLRGGQIDVSTVIRIAVRTPRDALAPLIHHRPRTGLEGKFSLEYGIVAALIDGPPGIESFSDRAVCRPQAQRLIGLVEVQADEGGEGLDSGELEIAVELAGGELRRASVAVAPGAPQRPPNDAELRRKLRVCAGARADELGMLDWESAPAFISRWR
jgi:2-methylcitrate dehydratase PrpD